jgi:hypothetical protein
MDNVVDLDTFKRNKEIAKKNEQLKKDKQDALRIEISPEQLRKIAFSMEQIHFGNIKASQETKGIIPDYDLTVDVLTTSKKQVSLVWYPMR